ncbi:hypothetical protein M514_07942 [Trichuris suis]|uniref:Tc1-like transposase DDE domain-containing protein n=1 Tax=Trichuris suis TaxID=68888 RepID=A0A085M1T2_9BILA|nr:hypothetical protein M513_07942 [Trichuris suis]KFD69430.1 hypothetical protein M514_07942 [Trichuris suis]
MTFDGDLDTRWTQMNRGESFPSRLCTCERAILIFWFHIDTVHFKFLNARQSIREDYYCHLLEAAMEILLEKRLALPNRRRVVLLWDNPRPHIARKTLQKISELSIGPLSHLPYSPGLSPTD